MSPSSEQSLEALFFDEAIGRMRTLRESFASFKAKGEGKETILRTLHTLKGSAGMVGFHEMAEEIHRLEDRVSTLEPHQSEQLLEVESRLKALAGELLPERGVVSAEAGVSEPHSPFSLAQRLLASVSRFESLLEEWRVARKGRGRDKVIKAEMAFQTEIKELRKHSFRLAFGQSSDLFLGLEELVQSVASAETKSVRLKCEADARYLLREYIPELRSALVHLVSNAVVHGLETSSQRESAGKEPTGTIEVSLWHESDTLFLTVCDDGAGINLSSLEERYRKNADGLDWSELSVGERMNLLFTQGTSLKTVATLHAGRGVGLSSVRETTERLGGTVCFEEREVGSCVSLSVPSPFFVANCLAVLSGGHRLAVLTSSISAVEQVDSGAAVPLHQLLGLPNKSAEASEFCLWLDAEHQAGVLVESCVKLTELVVYPAPEVDGLSDAVIGLSDFGQSSQLVVDLKNLSLSGITAVPGEARRPQVKKGASVLVVDDSETTRSILVDVLRRANYHVVEAEDGREALDCLAESPFKLVVSDLEMPEMDGLEFLAKLREESSEYAALPFLLFTSRDDTHSFQKAMLLGANRCLSKSAFQESAFLELVRDLI